MSFGRLFKTEAVSFSSNVIDRYETQYIAISHDDNAYFHQAASNLNCSLLQVETLRVTHFAESIGEETYKDSLFIQLCGAFSQLTVSCVLFKEGKRGNRRQHFTVGQTHRDVDATETQDKRPLVAFDVAPEAFQETCGMSMNESRPSKKQARGACIQFRHETIPDDIWENVAIMNQEISQQLAFVKNICLQQNHSRKTISYYEPLLQFIAGEMDMDECKDIAKLSRNDQERFFRNRVDVLVADLKHTEPTCHQSSRRLLRRTIVPWRGREKLFDRKHCAHGCVAPRLAGNDSKNILIFWMLWICRYHSNLFMNNVTRIVSMVLILRSRNQFRKMFTLHYILKLCICQILARIFYAQRKWTHNEHIENGR